MDELRSILAEVETLAQPPEEPDCAHARMRGRVVLLAQSEDRRHDEMPVLLKMLIKSPQRMQHLESGRALLSAVLLQDGEEDGDEGGQMWGELVAERKAQLLDEPKGVYL